MWPLWAGATARACCSFAPRPYWQFWGGVSLGGKSGVWGLHLMKSFRATLFLSATLAVAPLASAGAQTLQEALAAAYANNPALLAARAQLRAVDENLPQALAGWRPSVTFSGAGGYVDATSRSRSNDRTTYTDLERSTGSLAGAVTQPIYRGGRTVAGTRRAENQIYAQRSRLIATEQQVLLDSVASYVAVIRDTEVVRLNANNVQVLSRQLQATNERFRVGEITRTDVAQAESRLAGARAALEQADGNRESSRAVFQRLIGMAPNRVSPPQPLISPVRSAQEAVQKASTNNPTVIAAMFDEAAAIENIDLQFGALLPTIGVQGQTFRLDNSALPGTRQTGSQVTANLSVPIFQGGAEHAAVRQARQQAQQQRQLVEDARRLAGQQAAQAWETLRTARAQVESVRAQIRAQEIALDGVQREAVVGSRTTLDVLNAEQELLNARVSLVQALATLVNASYSLTATIGRLTAQDLGLPVQLYDPKAYHQAVRNLWVGTGDYSEVAARPAAAPAATAPQAPSRGRP